MLSRYEAQKDQNPIRGIESAGIPGVGVERALGIPSGELKARVILVIAVHVEVNPIRGIESVRFLRAWVSEIGGIPSGELKARAILSKIHS